VPELFPLVWPIHDIFGVEHWCCFAGLQPVVIRILQDAGYELDFKDINVPRLSEPHDGQTNGRRPIDPDWLRYVQQYDRCLCRYNPSSVQPEWLIAQVAHTWPDKKLMVWTKSLTDAQCLSRKLQSLGVDANWSTGRYIPKRTPQILLGTADFFSRDTAVQTRDIAIMLDATQISTRAGLEAIRYALNARMYGFLADDVQPEPFTSDLITAVYGFEHLHIPEHGRVATRPDVFLTQFPGGVDVRRNATPFEVQQQAIWRNKGRHAFIAKLARDIVNGETSDVRLAGALRDRLGIGLPVVAVMAANLEHALALGRVMPAATMLTGDDVYLNGLSRRDERRFYRSVDLDDRLYIVTPAAKDQIDGVDVVIKADARADVQEINVYQERQPLIIDVQDRQHRLLRRGGDQRREAYVERGCNLIGKTSIDPVEAFIGSRGQQNTSRRRRTRGRGNQQVSTGGYETRSTNREPRDPGYFFHERQRRRAERNQVNNGTRQFTPLVFADIFAGENLIAYFKQLKRENGQAPGIDGLTYDDLNASEVGQIARHVSKSILAGTYKPQQTRRVDILKQNGIDVRTLKLGVIFDRVVAKALTNALTPTFEQVFMDGSWGFRPERSCMQMLADMEAIMIKTGSFVIAIDDIRNAFDNVPIEQTITAHQQLLTSTLATNGTQADNIAKLLTLIETVLKGHDQQRTIGIDQGNPYSPTALNVLLQLNHDSPLHDNGTLWFRYADNLVYLSRSVNEGHRILGSVREYLERVNMTLKGEPGTAINLTEGNRAELLGTIVRMEEDRLTYSPGSEAWTKLNTCLAKAWESTVPQEAALAGVCGWVDSFGMTFESSEDLIRRALMRASEFGFRELNPQDLDQRWHASCVRWQECRRKAFHKHGIQ